MILQNLKKKSFTIAFSRYLENLKFTVLERSLVQLHLYGSDLAGDLHQFDHFGSKCAFFRMRLCLSFFQS